MTLMNLGFSLSNSSSLGPVGVRFLPQQAHFLPVGSEIRQRINGVAQRILSETTLWIADHDRYLSIEAANELRSTMRRLARHVLSDKVEWNCSGIPDLRLGRLLINRDFVEDSELGPQAVPGSLYHRVAAIAERIPELSVEVVSKRFLFWTRHYLVVKVTWPTLEKAVKQAWKNEGDLLTAQLRYYP